MIREEQEEAAGAACVSQSAEFALPGVASWVGTYVLCTCFCVCTYRERVLSFAPGLDLGAALPLLGCWIRQLRIKGCGSEKRC